ncbi:Crp/Fnr family transcriptional regulator [Limibacter armeniacum]|uniref:Crp/Fnr family transcriptional regulator n=1 Tax=Limibacter armeniacum TaxID=466084 RepID=UPI002FE69E63
MEKTKLWYFDNLSVLSVLSKDEKKWVSEHSVMSAFKRKELVYCAGDSSKSLYFLKEGKVKISRYSDGGKEIILDILSPGHIFGELSLTGEQEHNEIAEVLEDALVCCISVSEMENIFRKNPAFNLSITKLIGLRLKKVQSRLEHLCFYNAEDRVKMFISEQMAEHGRRLPNGEVEIKLKLTHEDIAKLTATNRQKVTTVLSALEKERQIKYNRTRILVRENATL